VAEGGGLLNRYTLVKAYRGFESLRLRHTTSISLLFLASLRSNPRFNPGAVVQIQAVAKTIKTIERFSLVGAKGAKPRGGERACGLCRLGL
jgi:hypothetical protein